MFIQTEETPNPATIKFIPGQAVTGDKTYDFASAQEAHYAPLAQRLFGIVGVSRVFLARDFVSVSKADDTDWSMLTPMILAALMDHFSTDQPIIDQSYLEAKTAVNPEEDAISAQIRELLEERVRPMVAMDGGDIVFDRFEDGIVFLQMRGACAGCPSSTATLKMGIENMLKHYVPEVEDVRAVEGY